MPRLERHARDRRRRHHAPSRRSRPPRPTDPTAFAQAFATELFTRDYTTATRPELISWAQYEDSPLRSSNYPQPDWTKVLVNSLTDITWDQADDTPIPADGQWLALHAQGARDSVSNVRVVLDPQWEQGVATGYSPRTR